MNGSIIITGSGRGIGAALAIMAGARGYAVCANYLENQVRAEDVVTKIRANGGTAIAICADVSDERAAGTMFDRVTEEFGIPVALINNAGITGRLGRLAESDIASIRRVIDVNVMGTIICSREAVRRMSTKTGGQGGSIVNISSRAAQIGSPNEYVHYAASKAAIESFSFGLAQEVAGDGIRVNCVSAGMIETEIHAAAGDPERIHRIGSRIPLGRAGKPEEVAAAVLWLLSPEASYCTGSILAVSGGR